MGVYIKGMEMPKTCGECKLLKPYHRCALSGYEMNYNERNENRPAGCPLVHVPPHGRLIDADAVTDAAMEDILGWEDAGCDRSDYRAFLDNYIEGAPTIIPAEEGE